MQFKLPELGEGVHEGELVKWRVEVGSEVKYDQPLCEVMTDKATIEIPSAFQGKVAQLHVKEGSLVKVGQLMLSFEGTPGSSKAPSESSSPSEHPSSTASPAKQIPPPPPVTPQESSSLVVPQAEGATRIAAAPSTRRFAREKGVDLSKVKGTGPHGRVMREDVESASSSRSSVPARNVNVSVSELEKRVPFRGLRKKIAEKMRLSKDKAAHFTYVEEADATALVGLRAQAKELAAKQGIKLTYIPFVMKAMAVALKHYPILNSSLDEERGELVYKNYYNFGLSVQTPDGLTAPVIKDVGSKSILMLAQEIQELVDRARNQKLTLEDLQGGTMTLTNIGSIGGMFATPVINYPEVAIVGFNKISRKPVVKSVGGKEEIVIRDWTYFSISLDHRIVDGAIGAEFLKQFIHYIENPALLMLECF